MSSIATKLRLKAQLPLLLLEVPSECRSHFAGFVSETLLSSDPLVQVVLFACDQATLNAIFPRIAERLGDDSLVWIAYPKKSGKIKSDLSRDVGWDVVSNAGYDGVTQIAIDETWSALRFKRRELIGGYLRQIPVAERQIEGVNFAERTVTLPLDAHEALESQDLLSFFQSLSFSHQREYVGSIVEAKKPETRRRRMEKMVENLRHMQRSRAENNAQKP